MTKKENLNIENMTVIDSKLYLVLDIDHIPEEISIESKQSLSRKRKEVLLSLVEFCEGFRDEKMAKAEPPMDLETHTLKLKAIILNEFLDKFQAKITSLIGENMK